MKKRLIIVLAFISQINFAQNTFPASGNVGIGTAVPAGKLHITNAGISGQLDYNLIVQKTDVVDNNRSAVGVLFSTECCGAFGKSAIVHERTGGYGIGNLHFLNSNLIDPSNPTLLDSKMTINSNGNIGIGTVSPTSNLHIYSTSSPENTWTGQLQVGGSYNVMNDIYLSIGTNKSGEYAFINGAKGGIGNIPLALMGGNVGIGTVSPTSNLHIYSTSSPENTLIGQLQVGGSYNVMNDIYLSIGTNKSGEYAFINGAKGGIGNIPLALMGGNVGIGITNPSNKLDVNGSIHSKEVKVDMIGWSDFVFKKEYSLPTLEEVEKQINEEGHLANIPSEEEVLKNGINLGEMNAKLLQKIEELTLYLIEQEKKNTQQNLEIEALKVENKSIKTILERLSKIEEKLK